MEPERFSDDELEAIAEDLVVGIYPRLDVMIRLLTQMRLMREELAQIDEVIGRYRP